MRSLTRRPEKQTPPLPFRPAGASFSVPFPKRNEAPDDLGARMVNEAEMISGEPISGHSGSPEGAAVRSREWRECTPALKEESSGFCEAPISGPASLDRPLPGTCRHRPQLFFAVCPMNPPSWGMTFVPLQVGQVGFAFPRSEMVMVSSIASGISRRGSRTRVRSPPRASATTTGTWAMLSQHRDPRDQKPLWISIPGSLVAGSNRGLDLQSTTRHPRHIGLTLFDGDSQTGARVHIPDGIRWLVEAGLSRAYQNCLTPSARFVVASLERGSSPCLTRIQAESPASS